MAAVTYYVALAFKKAEDDGGDIVACDPRRHAAQTKQSEWLPHWRGGRTLRSHRVLADGRSGAWRL